GGAQHLADLLGQLRKTPPREEHQTLLTLAHNAGHRPVLPLSRRVLLSKRSYWLEVSPVTAGPKPSPTWLPVACAAARAAAAAAAVPARRFSTQPSKVRCGPPDTASAPGGTLRRTTVPAPV